MLKNKQLTVIALTLLSLCVMMFAGCPLEDNDALWERVVDEQGYTPSPTTGVIPSAPTGVTATAASSSSITVRWNSVSSATSYDVYYEIGSSTTKNFAGNTTGTSYTHTGLTAGTTYYYYIKAKNSTGESTYSSSSSLNSATTSSSSSNVPSAPTSVTATAISSSSITVSWNPVSGATSYDVYYEIGTSSTKNFAGNTTGTSYTHTGLTADTRYYYYIKAKNSAGESAYSSLASSSSATTSSSVIRPSAPTGVTATVLPSSSILISWNEVSGATSYKVYYGTAGNSNPVLTWTTTSLSYTDTRSFLSVGETYYYKVSAVNSAGEGSASSVVSVTLSSSVIVPSAPTGVNATATSSSSITVSWNPVSGATSYDVYYEIGSSTTKNFAGNTTGTSYTHTGLTANTNYYYYIKAKNSAGDSAYSSFTSATTSSSVIVPSAPTGVIATATSSSSITVSWNPVSGATSYDVYYEIGTSSTKNFAGNTTGTSYTHTGLTANTNYYYYIKAKNSAGDSPYSSYSSTASAKTSSSSRTPLTMNQWANGTLTSTTTEVWYSFDVTSGTTYRIWWNDYYDGNGTKRADIKVSAEYSNGTLIFAEADSGWAIPKSFTASSSGTVYVKVEVYSDVYDIGTYGIVYGTGSIRP